MRSRYSSTRSWRISVWSSWPLPITLRSPPGSSLSCATAPATSSPSSVEFGHGSGSRSVREATYFGASFSIALNGLSCVFQ
jgi:hypothetical protein